MGIATCIDRLKKGLLPTVLIDVDDPSISEPGVFVYYDGAKGVDIGVVRRDFSILCSGFSLSGASELTQMLEEVEGAICHMGLVVNGVTYERTHPVVVTDTGLYIYKIDVSVIDSNRTRKYG